MFSVRVAETTTPGGISSATNLAVAGNRADAIGACVVPTFQTLICQDRAFRIRG